jgi:hypothetical protein
MWVVWMERGALERRLENEGSVVESLVGEARRIVGVERGMWAS